MFARELSFVLVRICLSVCAPCWLFFASSCFREGCAPVFIACVSLRVVVHVRACLRDCAGGLHLGLGWICNEDKGGYRQRRRPRRNEEPASENRYRIEPTSGPAKHYNHLSSLPLANFRFGTDREKIVAPWAHKEVSERQLNSETI